MRSPVIIRTPMPTVYEVADRMGVSHKRADELAALVLAEPAAGSSNRPGKLKKKAVLKRAVSKKKR